MCVKKDSRIGKREQFDVKVRKFSVRNADNKQEKDDNNKVKKRHVDRIVLR